MISRLELAALPTPVQQLPRLTDALRGPELFIKRDDLTGLAFGGNKTRKLEYLVADALKQEADLVITTGAVQSNHCRQTAAAAARAGLQAVLVLVGDPPPRSSANNFLDRLLGAELLWADRSSRDQVLEQALERARSAGQRPYLIPYGGSNALGAYAYLTALRELGNQVGKRGQPDWIVFATSSGGTQAGLAAGAARWNWRTRILGISVDEPERVLSPRIAGLAEEVLALSGSKGGREVSDIEVNDQYRGRGYAVMGEQEREAIRLFARQESVLLDPVYTGRAAAGLIDLIRQGYFSSDERVLFWHTGGTPTLFADAYQDSILT